MSFNMSIKYSIIKFFLFAKILLVTFNLNAVYKGINFGPEGSYRETCDAFKQDGDELFAVCENGRTSNTRTNWLPLIFCGSQFDIRNDKGVLKCRNKGGIEISAFSISTSAAKSKICDWDIDVTDSSSFLFYCNNHEFQKFNIFKLIGECIDLREVEGNIICMGT